jgi:AhpD family alkylhydroperoxidase
VQEREVLAFVLAYENACGYCMALHTVLAEQVEGVAPEIDALRHGASPGDPRLAVFASFVRATLAEKGNVSDAAWTAFRSAGYTEENALDVVLGIATYTLTTFANRLVQAPLDPFLERFRWDDEARRAVA